MRRKGEGEGARRVTFGLVETSWLRSTFVYVIASNDTRKRLEVCTMGMVAFARFYSLQSRRDDPIDLVRRAVV